MEKQNPSWVVLLCLLAFPACSDRNLDSVVSAQTSDEKSKLPDVDGALAEAESTDSAALMQAANAAFSQKRFEDAAFLLYAGQSRFNADMKVYPPIGTGGNSPATAMGAAGFVIGAKVNPAIMWKRDAFSRVLKRLKRWRPKYGYDYSPGWKYRNAVPKAERHNIVVEVIESRNKQMEDFQELLANDEYNALFRRLQEAKFDADSLRQVDGKNFKAFTPPSTVEIQKIESRMQEIESEVEIEGLFYKQHDEAEAEE